MQKEIHEIGRWYGMIIRLQSAGTIIIIANLCVIHRVYFKTRIIRSFDVTPRNLINRHPSTDPSPFLSLSLSRRAPCRILITRIIKIRFVARTHFVPRVPLPPPLWWSATFYREDFHRATFYYMREVEGERERERKGKKTTNKKEWYLHRAHV